MQQNPPKPTPITNPVILSNGTQIAEVRMANDATDAIVLPNRRATTPAEWAEYSAYVASLTLDQARTRLANRWSVEHTKDSDCAPFLVDNSCSLCHVDHTNPCTFCQRRGFHHPDCRLADGNEEKPLVATIFQPIGSFSFNFILDGRNHNLLLPMQEAIKSATQLGADQLEVAEYHLISRRKLATILAALRYWQNDVLSNQKPDGSHFEEHTPLTTDEIDTLCEDLNLGAFAANF